MDYHAFSPGETVTWRSVWTPAYGVVEELEGEGYVMSYGLHRLDVLITDMDSGTGFGDSYTVAVDHDVPAGVLEVYAVKPDGTECGPVYLTIESAYY